MANNSSSLTVDMSQSPTVPAAEAAREILKYNSFASSLERRVFNSARMIEWTRMPVEGTTQTERLASQPKPLLLEALRWASSLLPDAGAGQPRSRDDHGTEVSQRWQGVVREVHEGYFEAILTPLSGDSPEVSADVSLDAVTDSDVALVRPGATFYLQSGRTSLRPGMKVAYSSVMMRRVGNWQADELDHLRERAAKRRSKFEIR